MNQTVGQPASRPGVHLDARLAELAETAVHTQGGAHTRRSVATVGVLLLKGGMGARPCVESSKPKQGVVWPSTHKVLHTQGGAHKRRSMATTGVL